jgi:hypothetical protein
VEATDDIEQLFIENK